jgi:hypothetical protein
MHFGRSSERLNAADAQLELALEDLEEPPAAGRSVDAILNLGPQVPDGFNPVAIYLPMWRTRLQRHAAGASLA